MVTANGLSLVGGDGCVSELLAHCRNRIIKKHINVRVEHVQHSKCRDEFLQRVKRNEALRKRAKETGCRVSLKRQVGRVT